MAASLKCDYIGCSERLRDGRETIYCPNHMRIGQQLSNLKLADYSGLLEQLLVSNTKDSSKQLFSKMLSSQPHPDRKDRSEFHQHMDEWRADIVDDHPPLDKPPSPPLPHSASVLRERLQRRIRQKHTETRTNSKTHQKIRKKVKRIIREKGGEKITEEHEETEDHSERIESLVQFQTEQDVESYAEETTERYETKMIEYGQNKELVFSSLSKWFEAVALEKNQDQLDATLSIQPLLRSKLDLFQKQTVIYWQLWDALWKSEDTDPTTVVLPVLQHIIYYTIETFPDGPRKVFHCKFSHHKLAPESIVVSVPEIFLRAFPCYADVIRAFFVTKFIPFRKTFMKHCRQQELLRHSSDNAEVELAADQALDEEESGGFQDEKIPEINPRVCYVKKTS